MCVYTFLSSETCLTPPTARMSSTKKKKTNYDNSGKMYFKRSFPPPLHHQFSSLTPRVTSHSPLVPFLFPRSSFCTKKKLFFFFFINTSDDDRRFRFNPRRQPSSTSTSLPVNYYHVFITVISFSSFPVSLKVIPSKLRDRKQSNRSTFSETLNVSIETPF